jgi:hypothetical protein
MGATLIAALARSFVRYGLILFVLSVASKFGHAAQVEIPAGGTAWISVGGQRLDQQQDGNAGKGIAANAPGGVRRYSNTVQLDQARCTLRAREYGAERRLRLGLSLTLLYGTDYRFTTSHGMLSQQLLVKNAQYGFDPVMFYYDAYFPHVGRAWCCALGGISRCRISRRSWRRTTTPTRTRFCTPTTAIRSSARMTVKINDHWTVQAGISPGCDTMPWTTDAKVTGNVCVVYTWRTAATR